MIEDGHFVLPVRGHKHPQTRTRRIVTNRVPQFFQDRHQIVPSDEARMDHEQMLVPSGQVVRNAGRRLACQLHQVLPVLSSRIGPIRLLDDRPIDIEFLGLHTQGVKEQIVERNSLEPEPAQEFSLALKSRIAGLAATL